MHGNCVFCTLAHFCANTFEIDVKHSDVRPLKSLFYRIKAYKEEKKIWPNH